ncbi:MAG: CHAT domain-containing tetratricopeptide repeat protein [Planctomycetota bacterium]
MRKRSRKSVQGFTESPLRSGLIAAWLLVSGVSAQEPEAKPGTAEAIQRSVAKLEELVAKAEALTTSGDQATAREACKAALAAAALDEATPEWLAAADGVLWRLGFVAYRAGELRATHAAWKAVHEHRESTLPDEHPDLQAARGNLALTKKALGDLPAALALEEQVFAVFSRTLPDDHPDLQKARSNLANTKRDLGDLHGALALEEQVFAVWSRILPDDHPDLQAARQGLAITKRALGDLPAANALFEQVFAVRSRTLPDDHPDLQAARSNLALTKKALGDLHGALALEEQVFAVRSRTLPDDHPDLQDARGNLALTKEALGDLPGALTLKEQVFEVRSRTLPDDHPDLQLARGNLAATKKALGDLHGALALEEQVFAVRSRTLPDDHPDLQAARLNLAGTKKALGDLQAALALEEQVFAAWSRTLPDDHPDLQAARSNLAATKKALGDLQAAHGLLEQVFEVRSRTLPDDHPDLQRARENLATTKRALGDLPAAHGLFEQVFAVRSRTLPDEHPDLQAARLNLAGTKKALGDLQAALALQEQVFAVRSRNLPDDHPDLQAARLNLANTKRDLGDLHGALALEEHVLAVWSRILPDDHHDLQLARSNLAATKAALGDLPAANALFEHVFAVRSRTLPDDHPDLQAARLNLANTKNALGDLQAAMALVEQVFAVWSRTLPDDHPDLQAARLNLATTKKALGDLQAALALEEKVYAVRLRTLPDDHPDLQRVRGNLAITKQALGDLQAALALDEQVFAVWSQTLPNEHPDLQRARQNLAATKRALGDLPSAAQLNRSGVASALSRLSSQRVSLRDINELARQVIEQLSHVNSLLDLDDRLPAQTATELRHDGLQLLDATRSAELHTAHLRGVVRLQHHAAFADLTTKIAIASQELENAIGLPPEGRTTPAGKKISRADALRDATFAKDALERELLALIPEGLRTTATPAALTARLDAHEAAVAFLSYTRWTNDPEKPWVTTSERRYGAYLLTKDGAVTWHSLAPVATVDALIDAMRRDALAGHQRAVRSVSDSADVPGRDPEDVTPKPSTLGPRLTELRTLLFDPILAALPKDTTALTLSLADELNLIPLDELPLPDGKQLGDTLTLRPVWALRALLEDRPAPSTKPTALVLGHPDYDTKPETAAPIVPEAATPIVEPITSAQPAASTNATRSTTSPHRFDPLPATKTEAEHLASTFAKSFAEQTAATLLAADASEAAFATKAPGKTYLHLATHGYFAPEEVWKATDAKDESPLARFETGRENRSAQLSPYSLAGVALAGANLPADALGRREGILTAQEIVHIDLSACELATLSACKTSLGVRRAGTGLASLRHAFHAAGARYVLATLWEVNDAAADALMRDFYTRVWEGKQDPRVALRAAKKSAQERGAAFRDWAGWMISGR